MTRRKVEQLVKTNFKVIYDDEFDNKHHKKVKRGFKTRKEAEEFQKTVANGILVIEKTIKHSYEIRSNKQYTVNTWDDIEIQQFLKLARMNEIGLLYEVTLATGLRLGEVTGLSWPDVDFKERTIAINKTLTSYSNGNFNLKPLNYKRKIYVPDHIIEKLTIHKNKQEQLKNKTREDNQSDYNLVFTNSKGGATSTSFLKHHFKTLVKKAGVGEISFHDLRHTHARILIQKGVSMDELSVRLGHDINTILDFYSHLLKNENQD